VEKKVLPILLNDFPLFLRYDIQGFRRRNLLCNSFVQIKLLDFQQPPIVWDIPENNVLFLSDDAYYGNLTWYLARANKSVYVVMYVVKYDTSQYNDPVYVILRKLVDLHKRGVNVRVVVDDETKNSYPATINYLVGNGVPVRLDESQGKTTHCKIIVIDGQYVFIGSHNWTESALKYNHEATILVNSSELASQVEKYIESIWSSGRSISWCACCLECLITVFITEYWCV
jgi:hypothetical protein